MSIHRAKNFSAPNRSCFHVLLVLLDTADSAGWQGCNVRSQKHDGRRKRLHYLRLSSINAETILLRSLSHRRPSLLTLSSRYIMHTEKKAADRTSCGAHTQTPHPPPPPSRRKQAIMEDRHTVSEPRPVEKNAKDGPSWEVDILRDDTVIVDTFLLNSSVLPPRINKKGKLLWKLPDTGDKLVRLICRIKCAASNVMFVPTTYLSINVNALSLAAFVWI
jgi:hypothetical protein